MGFGRGGCDIVAVETNLEFFLCLFSISAINLGDVFLPESLLELTLSFTRVLCFFLASTIATYQVLSYDAGLYW